MTSSQKPLIPVPHHTLYLPTDVQKKNKVTYRPFLVKEQKVLLMTQSQQEQTRDNIYAAMVNVCEACIISSTHPINVSNLPLIDFGYIYAMIRAKSVGERVKVVLDCPHCKAAVPNIEIDTTKPSFTHPIEGRTKTIEIGHNTFMTFTHPRVNDFLQLTGSVEDDFNIAAMCLESIQTGDTIMQAGIDFNYEEALFQIDHLTIDAMSKVDDFFRNSPQMCYEGKFNCEVCKTENIPYKITETEDFFG